MTPTDRGHVLTVDIPEGRCAFKFVVDGEWVYDPNLPFLTDDFGNINNIIDVRAPDGGGLEVPRVTRTLSAPSSISSSCCVLLSPDRDGEDEEEIAMRRTSSWLSAAQGSLLSRVASQSQLSPLMEGQSPPLSPPTHPSLQEGAAAAAAAAATAVTAVAPELAAIQAGLAAAAVGDASAFQLPPPAAASAASGTGGGGSSGGTPRHGSYTATKGWMFGEVSPASGRGSGSAVAVPITGSEEGEEEEEGEGGGGSSSSRRSTRSGSPDPIVAQLLAMGGTNSSFRLDTRQQRSGSFSAHQEPWWQVENSGSSLSANTAGFGYSLLTPDQRKDLDASPHRSMDGKLVIVMVGLPARGKTYIARKLVRHLTWMGHRTRIFNVGNYRRQILGAAQPADFFDPTNPAGRAARHRMAMAALDDMLGAMASELDIAVYDATNTTRDRRRLLHDTITATNPSIRVVFIEVVCTDMDIIRSNVRETKLKSPDYADMSADEAVSDFLRRIEHYSRVYQPLDEEYEDVSYVKLIDCGRKVVTHRIHGYLQGRIVTFVSNLHTTPRPIWLSRHGQSMFNVAKRIGGDSGLSPAGGAYARRLAEFMNLHYPVALPATPREAKAFVISPSGPPTPMPLPSDLSSISADYDSDVYPFTADQPLSPLQQADSDGPYSPIASAAAAPAAAAEGEEEEEGAAGTFRIGYGSDTSSGCDAPADADHSAAAAAAAIAEAAAEATRKVRAAAAAAAAAEKAGEGGGLPLPSPPSAVAASLYSASESPTAIIHRINANQYKYDPSAPPATRLIVWTSTLLRTNQTAQFVKRPATRWRQLDEIWAGKCDGMTYEEIAGSMPEEYAARQRDKLHYRYPGGESYQDVIHRLEPVLLELMAQRSPVLIVAHQAVLRVLYGYLTDKQPKECPTVPIPLHALIQVTPKAYGCEQVVHDLRQ